VIAFAGSRTSEIVGSAMPLAAISGFTDNAKQSVVAVDGADLKGCRLADPQTAGVHPGKADSVDRVRYAAGGPRRG
jgi:hypothetical protein